MYPKLVALDTDWTIFWGWLDAKRWGKGRGAKSPVEDNIMKVNDWEIQDASNKLLKCGMYEDIPRIIQDIKKNGAKLAIVSRNTSKAMCDRALWYFHVHDTDGKDQPLIELVDFDEVYDTDKVDHFRKIKDCTGFNYSDMILYDDEAINNTVEMMLGVTFQVSRDQKGLTWDNYQYGLATWRRNKAIESPWRGLDLQSYPKRKFLGYSGMDLDTIELLEAGGRRHDTKEAARWGVCDIWIPERGMRWSPIPGGAPFHIAWSQEDRDAKIATQWGVQKPYILFAKHINMGAGFPVADPLRWNEMVIYPQVQESLIVINRMSNQELDQAIRDSESSHVHYEKQVSPWRITVPQETLNESKLKNEHFT
ncbi:hypothetical protein NM688_g2449 [Phlebia brevispora]|uniref:Uncharacterized protein n=1 Tax=Phlebia brevispora TaxID=194682 RepID=A0ACC1T992_9APHY|nr:hypothetical protein NM688_g2449 [Phlebia brevispora]